MSAHGSSTFLYGESIIRKFPSLDSSSWILSTRMKLLHTEERSRNSLTAPQEGALDLSSLLFFILNIFFPRMWKIINFGAVSLSRRVLNLECTTRALWDWFSVGIFFNILVTNVHHSMLSVKNQCGFIILVIMEFDKIKKERKLKKSY